MSGVGVLSILCSSRLRWYIATGSAYCNLPLAGIPARVLCTLHVLNVDDCFSVAELN
jgi:hypothetical protein